MKRRSKTASLQKKGEKHFGCHSANAAACEKTPRRSQKGKKKLGTYDRGAVKIYE